MNPMADKAIAIFYNAEMHECNIIPSYYAVSIHTMSSIFLSSAVKGDSLAIVFL